MKTFAVHYNSNEKDALEDAKFVQEKFSIAALVIPWAWALYNRLWIVFAAIFIFEAIMIFGIVQTGILDKTTAGFIKLAVYFYLAINASDFISKKLEKQNYTLKDVVIAKNEEDAKRSFFQKFLDKSNG